MPRDGIADRVFVPGARASVDEWSTDSPVFADVGKLTRVCAYGRDGVVLPDGSPSRSDPVPMPTTVGDAVADLHEQVGTRQSIFHYLGV